MICVSELEQTRDGSSQKQQQLLASCLEKCWESTQENDMDQFVSSEPLFVFGNKNIVQGKKIWTKFWAKPTKDKTTKIELEILDIFVVFGSLDSFKSIFFIVLFPLIKSNRKK